MQISPINNNLSCNNPTFNAQLKLLGVKNYLDLLTEAEKNTIFNTVKEIGTDSDVIIIDLFTGSMGNSGKKYKYSAGFLAFKIKTIFNGQKGKTYTDLNRCSWIEERLKVALGEVEKYYNGFPSKME